MPPGTTLLPSGYSFAMASGATIYAGHGSYASKSTDFGDTWTDFAQNFGSSVMSVFPASNGYLYAGLGNAQIWRSIDAGANWTLENTLEGGYALPWSWAENSDGDLFCGQYTGPSDAGENHIYLWRSIDDGDTWTRLDGLNAQSNEHVHVVFVDPETGRLYVSIGDSPKHCFYSDNDGDAWTELFTITDKGFTGITSTATARIFGDDRVPGNGRFLRTTDDAAVAITSIPKWEYNDHYFEVAAVQGTNTVYATIWNGDQNASQKSSIWKSTDDGLTWQLLGSAVSGGYRFHRICYDYRHRIPAELGYLVVEVVDNTQMMRIPI